MKKSIVINRKSKETYYNITVIEIFLYIMIFFLHANMTLDFSDDANFAKALDNRTVLSYMEYCYFNINGKVILDVLTAIFTRLHPLIWKIVNSIVFLIIIKLINEFAGFFGIDNRGRGVLPAGLLIFCFPFAYLQSAGWCATSINYIWPLCCMLIALIPVETIFAVKPFFKHNLLVYIGATIIAANQEQSGAILWTVYLLTLIYCYATQKQVSKQVFLLFIIVSLTLLLMFLSPGQGARINDYSIFRIPEWKMLSFTEKLQLGLTSTSAQIFFTKNYLYLYFIILLAYCVFNNSKGTLNRICGIFPILIYVSSNYFPPLHKLFSYSPPWGYGLPDFRPVNVLTYLDIRYYLPTFISILIIGAIIISFISIWDSWKEQIVITLIFSAGFVSRVIMGFSPTLYGSSYRTSVYMYFSVIICNYLLLVKVLPEKTITKNLFIIVLTVFSILQYIQSLHCII